MPTAGHAAISHWSVGTAASGAGKVLFFGEVTPNITIGVGVTPVLTTASTITVSGAGDTFENDIAKLILQSVAIADLAENDSSGPLTNLYLALHVAAITGASNQDTSPATYNGYARQAVSRVGSTNFTISGSVANLTSNISFAQVLVD